MKRIGNVLSWIGVVLIALIGLGAFGSGDVFAGLILILIAIALLPISPIKDLWLKLPKKLKWLKAVCLTVLFLFGVSTASPAQEAPLPAEPDTAEQVTMTSEEKDDGSKETKELLSKETKEEGKGESETKESEEKSPSTSIEKTDNDSFLNGTEVPTTTTHTPSTTTKTPVTTTTQTPVTTTTKTPVTTTTPPVTTTAPPITTTKPVSPGGDGDADNDDTNGQIVYKTPTGKRYHIDPQCGGKNSIQTTLATAQQAGLTPCKTCIG